MLGLIFLLSSLVAVFHHLAIVRYWYWIYAWFDLVMHFAGGFLIAVIILYIGLYSGHVEWKAPRKEMFLVTFGGMLVVGLLWEGFEMVVGAMTVAYDQYVFDTILDLVMDSVGAVAAFLLLVRTPLLSSVHALPQHVSENVEERL